jgi:threonyl-tRNA synthetase
MSVTVTLPDGSSRQYDAPVSALKVAEDISPRLAKAAVAAVVDGQTVGVDAMLSQGRHELRLLTDRDRESLEILRHSTAHLLAHAMVRLYGPGVQYTIGPALMDDFQYGFYYDFDLPAPISAEDLAKIEGEMQKIVDQKLSLQRVELPADQARAEMQRLGQHYKVEMIDDLVRQGHAGAISLYRQGDFVDMCRGPHVSDTGRIKAFKLLTAAGAYWRGDEKNKMLTRIYGTAFFDKKQLDEQLARIEEARKRDHRVLGKQLGLFLISDAVGPGLPLWMPKGAIIRQQLQNWLQAELVRRGYQSVFTPHIGRLELYRTSGHYPYYKDSQYPPILMSEGPCCAEAANAGMEEGYLLKPMNCPHHIQIYKAAQRSYRDLPFRLAEFGTVYRYEQSGELGGLTRVRGFTQDDAHLFCTPQQVEAELESCVELVKLVLATLEMNDYHVRVSLRDPASDKYVGDPQNWDMAEANIRSVVRRLGMNYVEAAGEAAFYGPKIDFMVQDCIGRQWQLGTIQVDYNLPERFGLEYIGADNRAHRPVMIHRAPFGSMERFIGVLIEHFGGAFPLWLAPVQVAVLPVSDKFNEYAAALAATLRQADIRVELDDSSEKIGAKIRRATLDKVPYMAVVGQREQEAKQVAVRHRTKGDLGAVAAEAFLSSLRDEINRKGRQP